MKKKNDFLTYAVIIVALSGRGSGSEGTAVLTTVLWWWVSASSGSSLYSTSASL